jgi:putative flippase GtrA
MHQLHQEPRHDAANEDGPPAAPVKPGMGASAGERWRFGMPARYGVIAVGSGLLMLGSAVSVPLGPAATTRGRELLTVSASAAGLALLIGASLPVAAHTRWRRWYRHVRHGALAVAVIAALGTLTVFAGAVQLMMWSGGTPTYFTDILSLTHTDAELVLSGRNPYTSDDAFRQALERYPYALGTPLRGLVFGTGYDHPAPIAIAAAQQEYVRSPEAVSDAFDPHTLHSYPALSYLVYVPFMWLGIRDILIVHIVLYWALFAWLLWRTPIGWRHWGALVLLAGMPTVATSLLFGTELICIVLVLAAWHLRDRRWLFAILLGLACAYKQYAWFFAPLLLLDVLLTYGWREALQRSAIVVGVFLVPNLPYLIASPGPWFASLWLPMSEPLFATGTGVIALAIGHIVPYGSPAIYAGLEVLALGAVLWLYARWRPRLGESAPLLALVPLFFAFRSAPNYFGFAPWLALYATQALYPRRAPWAPAPVASAAVDAHAARQLALVTQPLSAGAAAAWRPVREWWMRVARGPLNRAWGASQGALDWTLGRRVRGWIERQPSGSAGWNRRLVSFLVIGGIGTLVNLACFSLVYYALPSSVGAARWPLAFIAGTEVSILSNFLLNDWLTFHALPGHGRSRIARCARFHLTALAAVLVTFAVSFSLHRLGVLATLAQAAGILVATAFNFVFHHVFTYSAPHQRAAHPGAPIGADETAHSDQAGAAPRVRHGIPQGDEGHGQENAQRITQDSAATRRHDPRRGGGRRSVPRAARRSPATRGARGRVRGSRLVTWAWRSGAAPVGGSDSASYEDAIRPHAQDQANGHRGHTPRHPAPRDAQESPGIKER